MKLAQEYPELASDLVAEITNCNLTALDKTLGVIRSSLSHSIKAAKCVPIADRMIYAIEEIKKCL